MKEFEKWYKNEPKDFHLASQSEIAKLGWKAALEWALTHKKHINYKDYKFDWIKTDIIEEELNGKDKSSTL